MEKKRDWNKVFIWEMSQYRDIEIDGDANEVRIYD